MTTNPVTGIRIKDGKLIRVKTYVAGKRKLKADRLAKQWKEKGK